MSVLNNGDIRRPAGPAWVPVDACTLPTGEQPLRVAEFDELLAAAVTSTDRLGPGRLRLGLVPDPTVAARAADLAVREAGCCEFFTFTLAASGGQLTLEVTVPDNRAEILDALAERAVAGSRS